MTNQIVYLYVMLLCLTMYGFYVTDRKFDTPVPLLTAEDQVDLIKIVGKCYGIYGENE